MSFGHADVLAALPRCCGKAAWFTSDADGRPVCGACAAAETTVPA